jgi:protein SERAC1
MTPNTGLTELHRGDDPIVEHVQESPHACAKPTDAHSVVAIHGLNGDPFRTWATEGSEKMWLKDPSLLPSNLKNSRILTYGYNATVTAVLGKTSSDRILQHAHTLVAQLVADREVSLGGQKWSQL